MYRISRDRPWPPYVDLATARETLRSMHDDMKGVPELQDVAAAIEKVLREMDKAESVNPRRIGLNILTASRFTRFGH